jgi:Na+/proline symporter/signal transduction histidine kinase/CheY-like chemotaxis protein
MLPLFMVLVYAVTLFAFASWAEGRGNARLKKRLRFPAYALALAVYCTSWTFYGAVGSAVSEGWSYLPIYLGPILVFIFGMGFLQRLVEGVKADRAHSISEFIGGRFSNSRGVAALVTILALLGSIPYIALQLRSLATSFAMVSGGESSAMTMAVAALGLALFAMIYGTRHYDAGSRTDAVLFAVGFESLIKLGALLTAGGVALFFLSNVEAMASAEAYSQLKANFAPTNIGMDFFVITFLSMAAIVCLPRQFYIGVIEAQDMRDIARARWPFVIYIVLTLAVVIPISLAGMVVLPADSRPDLFVLELPLSQGMDILALFVFLGGFSAGTAMVLVEAIALATMVSNDLVAPFLLRRDTFKGQGEMGRALLVVRRLVIALVMLAAFGWAVGIGDNQRLASIGLVAFAAMAQFGPVLILATLGPNRDDLAAKAGLTGGLILWVYTLALPQLLPPTILQTLENSLFAPSSLFGIDGLSPISHGTLWSLGVNLALFAIVTMRRVRREAFPALLRDPQNKGQTVATVGELQAMVSRFVGPEITDEHFSAFDRQTRVNRSSARIAERLIAGVVGLPSARAFLASALHGANMTHAEIARLLDDTGQSLRFSKGLLAATLENIDPGVSVIDRDLNIVAWNNRYLELFNYPADMVRVGTPVAELIRYNAERGECGPGEVEMHVEKRLGHMRRGQRHSFERIRPDGRVLKTVGGPMPSGGYVMCFTDVTAEAQALAEVNKARNELESRVVERTSALHQANLALANADSEKTRFLAAASHDLLQPLHAARLFSAALERGSPAGQMDLIQKLNRSIESADTLLRALLDISKLDAGGIAAKSELVKLRPFLLALAETFAPMAREKGLSLRVGQGDATVNTDPVLLRSILQNFLSNAIRYTREGGIVMGVRRRGSLARIDVFDTGVGVPRDKHQSIFNEFERLPNSGDGGIGLGLAIVERTARLLNAQISMHSVLNKGSRFSISLPRSANALVTAPNTKKGRIPITRALSILIVDDDEANIEALFSYLSPQGHRVVKAKTAEEAVTVDEQFDVALIDFNLGPGADGLDVAQYLLDQKKTRAAALITAARREEYDDRARSLALTVFQKPITIEQLDQWLAERPMVVAAE